MCCRCEVYVLFNGIEVLLMGDGEVVLLYYGIVVLLLLEV